MIILLYYAEYYEKDNTESKYLFLFSVSLQSDWCLCKLILALLSPAKDNTLSEFKTFGHTLPFISPDLSKTLSLSS